MKVRILETSFHKIKVKIDSEVLESEMPMHSSRQVFRFKKFVIKLSASVQNRNEINFYKKVLKPEDAKFFPKLLASGKHRDKTYIVQERVDHKGKVEEKHIKQFVKLADKYKLTDINVSLWKARNGRMVSSVCNASIDAKGRLKIYDIGYRENQWW